VHTIHSLCSSLFVETTQQPNDTLANLAGRVLVIGQSLQPEAEQLQKNLSAHIGQ
jgi:hypothetical protein